MRFLLWLSKESGIPSRERESEGRGGKRREEKEKRERVRSEEREITPEESWSMRGSNKERKVLVFYLCRGIFGNLEA